MHTLRPAAVAGLFYPNDAQSLRDQVANLLRSAEAAPGLAKLPAAPPKALIAPHAGYIYSGPIAAHAYGLIAPFAARIQRVVLLGPAHRVAVRGLALPEATHFQTPLGLVEIDAQAVTALRDLPQVTTSRAAHALEHSLEVHLPFLQALLPQFRLIPLVVGDATAEEVAQVLERLWGGEETVIVASSDLSHYLPYVDAQKTDRNTATAILELRSTLDPHQACGAYPINGLLRAAGCARISSICAIRATRQVIAHTWSVTQLSPSIRHRIRPPMAPPTRSAARAFWPRRAPRSVSVSDWSDHQRTLPRSCKNTGLAS